MAALNFGPPPPSGDQSRAGLLNGISWTLAAISTIFVTLRLYTRLRLTRNQGWDDLLIVMAIILAITCASVITASTSSGFGRHAYYLTPDQISQAIKLGDVSNPLGIMAFCLPKIAVAMLIVRLLPPPKRGAWLLYTLTFSLLIFGALAGIFLFVQCNPPRVLWDPSVTSYHCWNPHVLSDYTYFVGAFSALVDTVLALFPLTIVFKLQIDLVQKITLSVVMGLGVFAAACAIIKTTTLSELADHTDFTWTGCPLFIWTGVEINVVIVCACIPTLRPLLRVIQGKDLPSKYSNRHGQAHRGGNFNMLPSDRFNSHRLGPLKQPIDDQQVPLKLNTSGESATEFVRDKGWIQQERNRRDVDEVV